MILKNIGKLYQPAIAEKIARELTENDLDGWKYEAKHDPTGKGLSYVAIYDENGELVGKWE